MRNALKQISPFKMFMTLTGAMFIMVAISVPAVADRLDAAILSNVAGNEVFEVTTKAE